MSHPIALLLLGKASLKKVLFGRTVTPKIPLLDGTVPPNNTPFGPPIDTSYPIILNYYRFALIICTFEGGDAQGKAPQSMNDMFDFNQNSVRSNPPSA